MQMIAVGSSLVLQDRHCPASRAIARCQIRIDIQPALDALRLHLVGNEGVAGLGCNPLGSDRQLSNGLWHSHAVLIAGKWCCSHRTRGSVEALHRGTIALPGFIFVLMVVR
jgi:hypothetical protein